VFAGLEHSYRRRDRLMASAISNCSHPSDQAFVMGVRGTKFDLDHYFFMPVFIFRQRIW